MDTIQAQPFLTDVMESLGYDTVTPRVFRAPWSTGEVEHYLYWKFAFRGVGLTFSFGVRNPESEKYARDCASLYGGLDRRKLQTAFRNHHCYMTQFSARLTSDTEQILMSLFRMSESELRSMATDIVQEKVRPALSSITSLEALRTLLVADEERCPWYAVNGAIRAAKLVKLGRMLGIAQHEIKMSLAGHEQDIQRGIRSALSAQAYTAKVMSHETDAGS